MMRTDQSSAAGLGGAGLEAFYDDVWSRAIRWTVPLVDDPGAAEDVLQEAFVRLAPRFGGLEEPEAYLRRTVALLASHSRRATKSRRGRELRAASIAQARGDEIRGPTESDPELALALARLHYKQRAALVLRYWCDWTDIEIADALGCTRSTVRSHVRRALKRLRADLQRSDHER